MSESKKDVKLDMKSDAQTFADALQKGIAEGIAMAQIANRPAAKTVLDDSRCGECRQLLRACQGEHETLVVFPQRGGKSFPGVRLNGVLYLSSNAGHGISVPKANDIRGIIQLWEESEDNMIKNRGKTNTVGNL